MVFDWVYNNLIISMPFLKDNAMSKPANIYINLARD